MDEYYFRSNRRAQVDVVLENVPSDLSSDLSISATLVTLNGQQPLIASLDSEVAARYFLPESLPNQQIWISVGEIYYGQLIVSDGLQIRLDVSRLLKDPVNFWGEGIRFLGPDAEVSELFNRRVAFRSKDRLEIDRLIQSDVLFNNRIDIDVRLKTLDEMWKKLREIDAGFLRENPSEFNVLIKNDSQSHYYSDLLSCYVVSRSLTPEHVIERVRQHKPRLVSNDSYGFYRYLGMAVSKISEEEHIDLLVRAIRPSVEDQGEFDLYVAARRQAMRGEKHDAKIIREGRRYLRDANTVLRRFTNEVRIKKLSSIGGRKGDIVLVANVPDDAWNSKQYLDAVTPAISSTWCRAFLNARKLANATVRERINRRLQEGNSSERPANDQIVAKIGDTIELVRSTHGRAEELIQTIRRRFPGSVLVIDVWGPWCSPCISDIKNGISKKKELEALGLKFVYVCVESSLEAWKRKVAELEIDGLHYYLDKQQSAKLAEFFNVRGYPSYFVLMPDGRCEPDLIDRLPHADVSKIKSLLENQISKQGG